MNTGDRIAQAARSWIGTPFRHAGREKGPDGGVDCVGVLAGVAHELGLTQYDNRVYSEHVRPDMLKAELLRWCSLVTGDPEPGDVLLFRIKGHPQHVGIYAGGSFIHAWRSVGFVVETRLDRFWSAKLDSIYRFDSDKAH